MIKDNLINNKKRKKLLVACIGQCVHVAGVYNFLNIAEHFGFECTFLGPAISNSFIINEIRRLKPDIVGLSYRLTPSTLKPILTKFKKNYGKLEVKPQSLYYAGPPQNVKVAKKFNLFDQYFVGGESKYRIISILRNEKISEQKKRIPMDLLSRIEWKKPFPIIRSHFGLSNLEDTLNGITKIANSDVLDVISIAPDQNTQANFFHPEDQDVDSSGAGGVPIRSREDLLKIHQARLAGNFPLLRIYAGTRDFIKLGKIFINTIKNAWAAIPIFWFNQMDSRGPLSLKESIKQHLEAIKWHAKQSIPVEINDSHHWSLRNAPDAIAVADMYLSGIIAKNLGVKHFIAQYMFNTPPGSSFDMDLAKILAKDDLLHTLADDNFTIIKQVRTGLASFPLNPNRAKGQLAIATMVQLAINPDIIHVVSFSEANHAARPEDIIESCNIVEQVVNKVSSCNLDIINDRIIERKEELIEQAKWIVNLIPHLAKSREEQENAWINYHVLHRLIKLGIFDAPHLKNNRFAVGKIITKIIDGGCYSWDLIQNKKLDEIERIKRILAECNIKAMDMDVNGNMSPKEVKI